MESFATDETGTFTVRVTDDLVEQAAALGREHGTAGGSWVEFDGLVSAHHALILDETGDPDWWENYGPASGPLSGEWADGMTPARLAAELDAASEWQWTELTDEICDAYEQSYYDAWRDEVLRMARYQVGES